MIATTSTPLGCNRASAPWPTLHSLSSPSSSSSLPSSSLPRLTHNLNFPKSFRGFKPLSATSNSTTRPYSASNVNVSVDNDDDDEIPFEVLPNGKRLYLDEEDVFTFLDPPKDLIPLDPSSYNPAAYLWKKIEDIPEERRRRLVSLLEPRLISRAWEIAGTRYDDPKLAKKSVSPLLSNGNHAGSSECWNCRTSGGPLPISWIKFFKKSVFICKNGKTYGRLIGGSIFSGISSRYPLYFAVRQLNEVMSTEQPCDFAYEFGDGLWDLPDFPQGFPKPAKHPWPFNDQVVIYVRHVGPGVLVGQAWQEGEALQQVPKKLCGEILMVKDYMV